MSATYKFEGGEIPYTPGSDVTAGDIIVLGAVVCVAKVDIAAHALGSIASIGVYDVDKGATAFSAGDAVYYNASGDVATKTTTDVYMGVCNADAAEGDATVRTELRSLQEVVSKQLGLGDLSDVHTATVTAGNILRADGVDFESVANSRANMVQEALTPTPIPLATGRVWDAPATNLVSATAANDDLALVNNTFLSGAPTVETGDLKNAGATTRKVRYFAPVPDNYQAGETLTLRINAGMKTAVASVSATVDAQVTESGDATTDICATAAQSINSPDAANLDFTLTPTNVAAGGILDIVISVAVNDSGTGTAVIGKINSIALLADTQG